MRWGSPFFAVGNFLDLESRTGFLTSLRCKSLSLTEADCSIPASHSKVLVIDSIQSMFFHNFRFLLKTSRQL